MKVNDRRKKKTEHQTNHMHTWCDTLHSLYALNNERYIILHTSHRIFSIPLWSLLFCTFASISCKWSLLIKISFYDSRFFCTLRFCKYGKMRNMFDYQTHIQKGKRAEGWVKCTYRHREFQQKTETQSERAQGVFSLCLPC